MSTTTTNTLASVGAAVVLVAGVAGAAAAAQESPQPTPTAPAKPSAANAGQTKVSEKTAARSRAEARAAAIAAKKRSLKTLPGGEKKLPLNRYRVGAGWGHSSGPHAGRNHKGLDFAAPSGAPIYSVTDGKVVMARSYYGYGNLVVVKTPTGKRVLYAHQSKMMVKRGEQVRAGEQIGKVGSTGYSTGPHLHFETRTAKDRAYNPLKFLSASKAGLQKRSNQLTRLR